MSDSSNKTIKAARQPQDGTPAKARPKVKKERRSRAKKRPDDVPGLIVALREGDLDQRVQAARDALAVRDALAREPRQVAMALVRDALTFDAVVMSRLQTEILRPDLRIVDEAGELNPLISRHWPEIRNGILRGGKALVDLEAKGTPAPASAQGKPGQDSVMDLSALVLAAATEADHDNE